MNALVDINLGDALLKDSTGEVFIVTDIQSGVLEITESSSLNIGSDYREFIDQSEIKDRFIKYSIKYRRIDYEKKII